MTVLNLPRRRTRGLVLLLAGLVASGVAARPGLAQEAPATGPDLAAMEAQYEQLLAAALEQSEEVDPMHALHMWGAVLESAFMLDHGRRVARGESRAPGDAAASEERVLEHWRRLRPDSGGPELFRAFRLDDPAAKRDAVVALLDRYPDDALVVWQAVGELTRAGEVGRAAEAAETFLARNPEHPQGYRILAQSAGDNETRLAEALARWADAVPGDPALVRRWLGSWLPQQEPEATRRVLADFFAGRPAGAASLETCLQVMRRRDLGFAGPAQACVARIAGEPDLPPHTSERAVSALAEMAAAAGDRSALLAVLAGLEPEARVRALITAAHGLEAPERCGERIGLLSAAAEAAEDATRLPSIASALRDCSDLPAAQALMLALLRQAPADQVRSLVSGWVVKVNDVYRGELPEGAAGVLEERLREEPHAGALFHTLDVVYQIAQADEERFELLRRWQRLDPASLDRERVADLAEGLVGRGDPGAAVAVLEQRLESRFEAEVAELLWELYLETAGDERAGRFAADLIAAPDRWRTRAGHTLAARSALLREDLATAERHYWQALAGEHPSSELAVELLEAVGWHDAEALEGTALRICGETRLATGPEQVAGCAADLLARAGSGEAAAALLAARAEDLPEDLKSLRELASTAHQAGQPEVAERAWRRILELDPRSETGWVALGRLLENQGHAEEVEELLERSRSRFSPPPSYLSRSAGRALTAAGRPRRAIDVLLEARAALPDTEGGDWSRSWIDYELRAAYRGLGQQALAAAAQAAPAEGGAVPPQGPADAAMALLASADEAERARGVERLAQAAGRSDALAVEILAFLHATGIAVPRDPAKAAALVAEAARLGSDGFDRLRRQLADSEMYDDLLTEGKRRLLALADGGDPAAMALVARLRSVGLFPEVDAGRAVALARRAAAAGEGMAMRVLSIAYRRGDGVEPDPAEGVRWLRRGAEAGDSFCMMFYGNALLDGEAVAGDRDAGLRWLRRSAEAGNWWATHDLGRLYDEARHGVGRDADQAAAWKRRLADLGDAESTGWLLYHGYR